MRRERRGSINLSLLGAVIFIVLLTACGTKGEDILIPNIDFQDEMQESADNNSMETEAEEDTQSNTDTEDEIADTALEEKEQELTSESMDSEETLSEEDTLPSG